MSLEQHAPNVWAMSQGIRLMPGVVMPATGLVVRLASGGVVLVSPLSRIDEHAAEIRALGPVEAIVAPNYSHHLAIPKTMAAFPSARVWGSKALAAKRTDIAFTDALEPDVTQPWGEELVALPVRGMPRLHETAFFHRPSGTLYLVDLAFNLARPEQLLGRMLFGLMGPTGRFSFPRMFSAKDKPALRKTIDQLVAFAPKRIIVSHGVPVTENATEALKAAFAFLRA